MRHIFNIILFLLYTAFTIKAQLRILSATNFNASGIDISFLKLPFRQNETNLKFDVPVTVTRQINVSSSVSQTTTTIDTIYFENQIKANLSNTSYFGKIGFQTSLPELDRDLPVYVFISFAMGSRKNLQLETGFKFFWELKKKSRIHFMSGLSTHMRRLVDDMGEMTHANLGLNLPYKFRQNKLSINALLGVYFILNQQNSLAFFINGSYQQNVFTETHFLINLPANVKTSTNALYNADISLSNPINPKRPKKLTSTSGLGLEVGFIYYLPLED
jgi:hypothetical protein